VEESIFLRYCAPGCRPRGLSEILLITIIASAWQWPTPQEDSKHEVAAIGCSSVSNHSSGLTRVILFVLGTAQVSVG
jgi:hypothetical protein